MNTGDIIIGAIVESNAIEPHTTEQGRALPTVWHTNAGEQIEATLHKMGFKLVPLDNPLPDPDCNDDQY
jgi:hypothetical protein